MLTIKPLRYQRVAGEKPGKPRSPRAPRVSSRSTHLVMRQPITVRDPKLTPVADSRTWTPRGGTSTSPSLYLGLGLPALAPHLTAACRPSTAI